MGDDGLTDRSLPSIEELQSRLFEVQDRISAASTDGATVAIVGVTKTFPAVLIRRALAAGLVLIGENYGQDLEAKAAELAGLDPAPQWHFIGQLQRNKIKRLAGIVDVWQTVDRSSIVSELEKRAPGAHIYVQVNTTDEPQKAGCSEAESAQIVDEARAAGLQIDGLMTIGPTSGEDPRPSFERLRSLAEQHGVGGLSMGMSGDYETAVACGATVVRLGSVLFGPRG